MLASEYNIPSGFGMPQLPQQYGTRPRHKNYSCGHCGRTTNGRVLCDLVRETDNALVSWCVCSCERCEPTVVTDREGELVAQVPLHREFNASTDWPGDLIQLYDEASHAFCAGAFTGAGMLCRKILMACACDKGADDGKSFQEYVGYITDNVLTYPDAKASIDKIRNIGNEANHKVSFVSRADAERAMKIVTYMLNTIYSLPSA